MFTGFLHLHNLLRWVVLALCVACVARATVVDSKGKNFEPRDRKLLLGLTIACDTQLLLGLTMYFLFSPMAKTAFAAWSLAMKDRVVRYWAIEHGVGMLLAIALVHVANVRAKRAGDNPRARQSVRRMLVAALLLFLLTQPWPFLPYGRSLIP